MPNSPTSLGFLFNVGKNRQQDKYDSIVTPLSYFSFAWRILLRDRLYSIAYGSVASVLFLMFFISVRLHFYLFGSISLSSIVSFEESPQILFYTSLASIASLFFFHTLHRIGDIGVMMAVGGNRIGCIWLHTLALFCLFLPSAILGVIFSYLLVAPKPSHTGQEVLAFFSGFAFLTLFGFLISIPTVGLTTYTDPYKSIRRQK